MVSRKEITTKIMDSMKAQIAFQAENGKIKRRRIIRVLEYNGKPIAEPLDKAKLDVLLGKFSEKDALPRQPDLFE
jgi:hypothetical protein